MEQLLVALDVDTADQATELAEQLRGVAGGFKIGSRLFTSHGPSLVSNLVARGDRVFLDLKFHDIPNTVAGAVAAATRLGVWMIDVHATGGTAMLRAARDAVNLEAARGGTPAPLLVAITVLTSLNETALGEIGVPVAIAAQVERLAVMAGAAGLDGVVASPHEIALVRARLGNRFVIVTPGIRGPEDKMGDQSRTLTAAQALAAGSHYLVVGRPIIGAPDPRAAAERMVAECRGILRL